MSENKVPTTLFEYFELSPERTAELDHEIAITIRDCFNAELATGGENLGRAWLYIIDKLMNFTKTKEETAYVMFMTGALRERHDSLARLAEEEFNKKSNEIEDVLYRIFGSS